MRELRLWHAARLLTQSTLSITHLAYDCGFHTPSVFIDAFKQYYGQTPRQYRQKRQHEIRTEAAFLPKAGRDEDLSALIAYIREKKADELSTQSRKFEVICDLSLAKTVQWRTILNIGYARDGLMAPIQEQIQLAQREIGFTYLRFHGIFDEDMHIYSEDADGRPQFNFAHTAMLFDFILSTGLTPFVELSFVPSALAREQTRIFDRPSVISGCIDMDKWSALVEATLRFFITRYGRKQVENWRFTTLGKGYAHIGCLSLEEHEAIYCAAYRAVKKADPLCQFGGPSGFAYLIYEQTGVARFLDVARDQGCVPDFISMQCHPHMQTGEDALFMNYTLTQQSAPAVLSSDPDFMVHALDALDLLLDRYGLADREVYLDETNATLWQRDLSSDTCYKAAWLAKNVCESYGRITFGYWLLTDLLEERAFMEDLFHGGYGLLTYNGVPKAGYQAMRLLSQLGGHIINRGAGWLLTQGDGAYRLMTYNYCSYSNLYRYRYKRLEGPEDAYSVFEVGEIQRMQFYLTGIADGVYRAEHFTVTRQNGSAFDAWLAIGAPRYPDRHDMEHLYRQAQPDYRTKKVRAENGLRLEISLLPHEIEFVLLYPYEDQ